MNTIITKIKEFISTLASKIGSNKMHMLCSLIVTFAFGLINIPLGVILGYIAGIAKELYDKYIDKEEISKDDLKYDAIGIVLALIILIII